METEDDILFDANFLWKSLISMEACKAEVDKLYLVDGFFVDTLE